MSSFLHGNPLAPPFISWSRLFPLIVHAYSIENHPDHLPSMLLLGSIGVLDHNEAILEAVMDDLYSVRGNNLEINLKDKVDKLLTVISQLQNKSPIPTACSAVFLRPAHPGPWLNLAQVSDEQYAADMARKVASRGKFSAEVVADAWAGVGKAECDQRAIMIAPWRESGWVGLKADVQDWEDVAVAVAVGGDD